MAASVERRRVLEGVFLGSAGLGWALANTLSAQEVGKVSREKKITIVGVSCSPRPGKTTAQGLKYVLEAAKGVAPDRIETVLIELAGLRIPVEPALGLPLLPGDRDDFPQVAEQIASPQVRALIVGSPVHYGNMSTLCKAFLDRLGQFRKEFVLSGRLAGALAVGAARNGGQEYVLESIHRTLLCHEMMIVGDGRPTGHFGATLWNPGTDDISGDEIGIKTAQNLGRHIATLALRCNSR
jgi:multimeric flavodoxin WrbA